MLSTIGSIASQDVGIRFEDINISEQVYYAKNEKTGERGSTSINLYQPACIISDIRLNNGVLNWKQSQLFRARYTKMAGGNTGIDSSCSGSFDAYVIFVDDTTANLAVGSFTIQIGDVISFSEYLPSAFNVGVKMPKTLNLSYNIRYGAGEGQWYNLSQINTLDFIKL